MPPSRPDATASLSTRRRSDRYAHRSENQTNSDSHFGQMPMPEAGGPNYCRRCPRARWEITCGRKKQGGVAMVTIRRTAWFFTLAIVMAGGVGVCGSFRGVGEAGE